MAKSFHMLHQKINKGGVIFAQKGTLQIVAVQQNHGQRLKNIVKNLAVVGVEAQHDYKADGRVIPADGGTADIYSHTGTRTAHFQRVGYCKLPERRGRNTLPFYDGGLERRGRAALRQQAAAHVVDHFLSRGAKGACFKQLRRQDGRQAAAEVLAPRLRVDFLHLAVQRHNVGVCQKRRDKHKRHIQHPVGPHGGDDQRTAGKLVKKALPCRVP